MLAVTAPVAVRLVPDLVAPDEFCGIVNANDGTPAPWSFTDKKGKTSYRTNEFFEGGINLSYLGLQDRCFSSFLSETRSSTSTSPTRCAAPSLNTRTRSSTLAPFQMHAMASSQSSDASCSKWPRWVCDQTGLMSRAPASWVT